MATIQPINGPKTYPNKKILSTQNTGYLAFASMGLATASAMIKSKSLKKHHKHFAFIAGALTLLHIGTAIHGRREFKKQTNL